MSAITGIFYRDGRTVDSKLIKKMNNKLSHRGKDGSNIWCEGPIAFGHQMLFTTQESLQEKLPFHDKKARLVITADARIDNRKELSEELEIEDIENVSDSYFILKSYEKWDEKCPEHLLGDFAFAIWDDNKNTLFCARDHMGVKPFYYYLNNEMFVFGTEIKALLGVPGVPNDLNKMKLALYLADIYDKKLTFYNNIFSLIGSNLLTITNNKCQMNKYWELNPNYQVKMDSDEDYIKEFLEIYTEAVKCRLRSAFPIGFELSGGLDSSSVVCMAKNILSNHNKSNRNIKTFSIIYEGFLMADESYYIKKVVDKGGIQPNYSFLGNISPLKDIDNILLNQEQPFFTPFIANIWNFKKKIKNSDIRVLLSGNGSDEIFDITDGYFRELTSAFKWKTLFKELNSISKLHNVKFHSLFLRKVFFPIIPQKIKDLGKKTLLNSQDEDYLKNILLLNKNFMEKLGGQKYLEDRYLEYYTPFFNSTTAKNTQYKNIDSITDNIYYNMIDRLDSAFDIEARYPFLDKRLIEFIYGIPNDIKFRNGLDKYILRIAMDGVLPAEIQYRVEKGETDEVFYKNFMLFEKDHLENMIFSDTNLIGDYVDLSRLEYFYRKYKSGKFSSDLISLWLVSLVFLWLKSRKSIKKNDLNDI